MKILKCFKYIWKVKDGKKDVLNCKIITGVDEDHKNFMQNLQKNPDVLLAVREYLYEIDIEKMSKIETLKSEVIESEKN